MPKVLLFGKGLNPLFTEHCSFAMLDKVNSTKQKILDMAKLKAFADNKIELNEKLDLVLGRVEKIVGKGENASYQQCFQKLSLSGSLKFGIVW